MVPLDLGTFGPDPMRFFLPERKKNENFDILRKNFPIKPKPKMADPA